MMTLTLVYMGLRQRDDLSTLPLKEIFLQSILFIASEWTHLVKEEFSWGKQTHKHKAGSEEITEKLQDASSKLLRYYSFFTFVKIAPSDVKRAWPPCTSVKVSFLHTCPMGSNFISLAFLSLLLGSHGLVIFLWKGGAFRGTSNNAIRIKVLETLLMSFHKGLVSETVHISAQINGKKCFFLPPAPSKQRSCACYRLSGKESGPWLSAPEASVFWAVSPAPAWFCILVLLGCRSLKLKSCGHDVGQEGKGKWAVAEQKSQEMKSSRTGNDSCHANCWDPPRTLR